jgi:beta-galactosidase
MLRFVDTMTCLNGWWDFQPGSNDSTDQPPDSDWQDDALLVPSLWNQSVMGYRLAGENQFRQHPDFKTFDYQFDAEPEFLFDGFGYPLEWSQTDNWWVRRQLPLETLEPGRRYLLLFEAVSPQMTLYVNGQKVCDHLFPDLPCQVDVTEFLHQGENTITVHARDYERDEQNRATVPIGTHIPTRVFGIWQDVWLIERPEVYVRDVVVTTSVRENRLDVSWTLQNESRQSRCVSLEADMIDWAPDTPEDGPARTALLESQQVSLAAGESQALQATIERGDLALWQPDDPVLYQVRTTLRDEASGETLEIHRQRFGFREVWIEGKDLLLNGTPLHLFSDWGHKIGPWCLSHPWVQKWFGMIRDGNMNHSRLHTCPHPTFILDMADEQGILITGELMHGSGNDNAVDLPAFWDNAAEKARRFIQRDRNHPSLILWSASNEMRWNRSAEDNVRKKLPAIGALMKQLDPTRPVYFDGDSSLWDETRQEIISRHYGNVCAGTGWWDKSRPLSSGEMCYYHLQGPNNTLHVGGDEVFADFAAMDAAAGIDTARVIEAGRVEGVCCLGPWNQSCNVNLRTEDQPVELTYDDYTTPGLKPLRVNAHASEFAFWKEGKGYTPQGSFAIQAEAFRPFAIFDLSYRSQYFRGCPFQRTLHVINDTPRPVTGQLHVTLVSEQTEVASETFDIQLGRGRQTAVSCPFDLPADLPGGAYVYRAEFRAGEQTLDAWSRRIDIAECMLAEGTAPAISASLGILSPGDLHEQCKAAGLDATAITSITEKSLDGIELLLIDRHCTLEQEALAPLETFLNRGGRAVFLEQRYAPLASLPLKDKPVLAAFTRSPHHPVVNGIGEEALRYWGDDPFPLADSDSTVALRMFPKGTSPARQPLLDSGVGGFGRGDLDLSPLVELRQGRGMMLCCQLRVGEKLADIPAAEELLVRMLQYADTWQAPQPPALQIVAGQDVSAIADAVRCARDGGTVLVNDIPAEAMGPWADGLGVALAPLELDGIFQAVRVKADPVLDGISNEDTCGIEKWTYTPPEVRNYRVASVAILPAEGIEPLLETPRTSGLTELFEYGGATEPLRAHTVSRFCYGNETPPAGVILGRVPLGKGVVYINQFAPPESRPRFERFYRRLVTNLGQALPEESWFAAGLADQQQSTARPARLLAANIDEVTDDMLHATRFIPDQFISIRITDYGDWTELPDAQGTCSAERFDADRPIGLYYLLVSSTPRKNMEREGGLPNPELMTFLDIIGDGEVDVYVNAHDYGTLDLSNGSATASDITIESGRNHVLLLWKPAGPRSNIQMQWRNIMGQPETDFQFI